MVANGNGNKTPGARASRFCAALWAALAIALLAAAAAAPGDELLAFLNQTIGWYEHATQAEQSPADSQELIFRDALRQNSRRIVQLGFAFARAQAANLTAAEKAPTSGPAASQPGKNANLVKATAAAVLRVSEIQTQLDQVNKAAQDPAAPNLPVLIAQRDKLIAELNLAIERRDVLQNFSAFASDSGNGNDLLQKIDDLARSVPGAQADPQSGPTTRAAVDASSGPTTARPETMGIVGLITEMFSLSGKMSQLKTLEHETESLRQANDKLRLPLRAQLTEALHQADAIHQGGSSDDVKTLVQQRQQIESVSDRFRLLTNAAVPLGEQNLLLDSTHNNVIQWRGAVDRQYHAILHYLLIRLGLMVGAILLLLGVSKLWRRAAFRYVTDIRRRRQFLLIRRLVVGGIIAVIVIAGAVSEFSSLATYAGLLTAGIAVALQTVILSGVAHLFFLGRYGVRVGDRVTISGITGDVIDIGIFRLYMMELGEKDAQPTGRIVVFSNSVLFQPTAFFKQMPGADYGWHRVTLTLSPDSDYRLAENKLVGAVESVYADYRDEIERQHARANESTHMQMPAPHPEGRLKFVDAGLEFSVRYPVEIRRASEIDDRVTRKLLETIEKEPKLRLVASSTPNIQAAPAS